MCPASAWPEPWLSTSTPYGSQTPFSADPPTPFRQVPALDGASVPEQDRVKCCSFPVIRRTGELSRTSWRWLRETAAVPLADFTAVSEPPPVISCVSDRACRKSESAEKPPAPTGMTSWRVSPSEPRAVSAVECRSWSNVAVSWWPSGKPSMGRVGSASAEAGAASSSAKGAALAATLGR